MRPSNWRQSINWRQWAGGLGVLAAIALAGTRLQADDESPRKRERAEKAAAEEGKSRREERKADADSKRSVPQHYWLGLECMPAPGLIREQLNLPEGQGLVVEITAPEGPAAKAGLKKHDILLTANDKPLGELRQLIDWVQESDGKAISFKLLRGGKETTVEVTPVKGDQPFKHRARVIADDRVMEQMERLRGQLERGGDPIRMRFFHPGVVLPPGANPLPPLPDDMRITITRRGAKPAEIEVQQGDETWKGTEDDMSKMPDKFQAPVGQMLARSPARMGLNVEMGAGAVARRGLEDGMNQRVMELTRQVEQIRQELQSLNSRRAGGREDGGEDRRRGPRDKEGDGRERRGEAPSPPRPSDASPAPPAGEPAADAPAKP